MLFSDDLCKFASKVQDMKKIVIIDGGPRRNMNTAQMLQKFAEGVNSANEEILMLLDLGFAAEGTGPLANHGNRKELVETVSCL